MKLAQHGATLVLDGKFFASAKPALDQAFPKALEAAQREDSPVVFDFTRVPSMDSEGFSIWISLERLALEAGTEVRVRGASPLIRELFEISDLEEVLEP